MTIDSTCADATLRDFTMYHPTKKPRMMLKAGTPIPIPVHSVSRTAYHTYASRGLRVRNLFTVVCTKGAATLLIQDEVCLPDTI